MNKYRHVLVVSHIAFRNVIPYDRVEGPYSSVCQSLSRLGYEVTTLLLPLVRFDRPIFFGLWQKEKMIKIVHLLGRITVLKYIIDFFVIFAYVAKYTKENRSKKTIVVGIDPLCALPLALFKKITQNKFIFYSVDFNEKRFANKWLQYLYEMSDEVSSRNASLVWVVCESLQNQKKKKYGVFSYYIPNSSMYNETFFKEGKDKRTGDKLVWTGSCVSERQFTILFKTVKTIQQIVPNLKPFFAPVGKYDEFIKNCKSYKLRNWHVLQLKSRSEWQEFAATCDVGIAIYDDQFGSTKYIEPLKIWDFMLCGLPFIISSEPSLNREVKGSGIAYLLDKHNIVSDALGLRQFIQNSKQPVAWEKCISLAKKYDIGKKINESLKKL